MSEKVIEKKNDKGEVTETTIIHSPDQQNSIKIARNAKGDYSFEVKVYADTAREAAALLKEYKQIAEQSIG